MFFWVKRLEEQEQCISEELTNLSYLCIDLFHEMEDKNRRDQIPQGDSKLCEG